MINFRHLISVTRTDIYIVWASLYSTYNCYFTFFFFFLFFRVADEASNAFKYEGGI